MDFKKLITRYRQFGGFRLVVEYAKLGMQGTVVKGFFKCLIKRQSFKAIYPGVLRRVEPMLVAKYSHIVEEFKSSSTSEATKSITRVQTNTDCTNQTDNASTGSATVWFCWLQGIDDAPEIVKACYNSIKRNIPNREMKVIDAKNWREYVGLPEYIVKKWEKGHIPAALFSDLLRLELLILYGGTWIDSTVLCTGGSSSSTSEATKSMTKFQVPSVQEYLNADLFLFQYSRQGSKEISISNWFITARRNNEVLMVLREMLYAYWKDYDCVLDYYMFHLFFSMIAKEYPEVIANMPYGYSPNSLVLLHHWGEKFDKRKWDKLTSQVCFHKLAFRVSESIKSDNENFYNYILRMA